MTDNKADETDQVDTPSVQDTPSDPDAANFAQVTSGIYRRVVPEAVWSAVQYAVRHQLPAERPMLMLMFVRIAEVYPEVSDFLRTQSESASADDRTALQLILDPPEGIRNAEYLPEEVLTPGEMDMCWAEFLVTGSTDPIEKVMAVLDREDLSRGLIDEMLLPTAPDRLEFTDDERTELASIGIALGRSDASDHWRIASPGDIDVLVWFGLKKQNTTCQKIVQAMEQSNLMHLAVKGAAIWSLKANANQHGNIRLYCIEQAKIAGGIGRQLIAPTT